MIRRLRDYYRQFEELSPEEISVELRERRDDERASALTEVHPLDLTTPAWHEPPDAEAINAATYALRRAVNAYPDDSALREALAERHGVSADQVAPGHGAGELLHAAFGAIAAGGRVAIAWPGWSPLPRLVHEAGGTPVPVPVAADGPPDLGPARPALETLDARARHPRGRAVLAERPDRRDSARAACAGRAARRAGLAGRSTPRWPSSRPTRTPASCSARASACSSCARSRRRTRWPGCAPATRSATTPPCSTGVSAGRRRLRPRPGGDAVGGPRRRAPSSGAAAPPPPASASGWPPP